MKRHVTAELEVEITAPTTLEFQIAIAPHPDTEVCESLSLVCNGDAVRALEISGMHGNRIHKLHVPPGALRVSYAATIVGRTAPAPVTECDLSMYLRPSRYAEADKFYPAGSSPEIKPAWMGGRRPPGGRAGASS